MARRRWYCPQCGGGILAPSRMAADDTRRFCLECSAKSPKLVARTCPSMERVRERKQETRNRRERNRRQRERDKLYRLTDGSDLRVLIRRVKALTTWRKEGERVRPALSKLTVEVTDSHRSMDADGFVMDMIGRCASRTLEVVRKTRSESNLRSLILAAGCEYFGLDQADVIRRHRVTHALRGRADDKLYYPPTIIAAARAARSEHDG